jgi:hypothetical protein
MATLIYPDNATLTEVAQVKQPMLLLNDPIFELMPIVEVDASKVIWDQEDDYLGLQQVRGINGAPPKVARTGAKQYEMKPGVYGEHEVIDEAELTNRRQPGSFNAPINIADLIARRQDKLLSRRIDRIRYIGWTLLTSGTFSVANADSQVIHTDTFALQTYTAGVTWATVATATPLANLRAVQLLGRGKGVNFGAGAQVFMNRVTANSLLSNTNSADLGGRRVVQDGQLIAMNIANVNTIMLGEDLPTIRIWDDGYLNDAGTFVPFIPNNKAVVVGARPAGQTIAQYQMTRNANNPDLEPGAYMKVIDKGENSVPRTIEVHDCHNGGPAIFYPGSVVIMTV